MFYFDDLIVGCCLDCCVLNLGGFTVLVCLVGGFVCLWVWFVVWLGGCLLFSFVGVLLFLLFSLCFVFYFMFGF